MSRASSWQEVTRSRSLLPWRRLRHRWRSLPVRVRGCAIVAIPITCLVASLGVVAWLKVNLEEDEMWVQHTQIVRLETKQLLAALVDAETGMRGYGLTGRDEFLEPYDRALVVIPRSLDRLEGLVQDNPPQVAQVQAIRTLVRENLALLQYKIALQRQLWQVRDDNRDDWQSPTALYDWLNAGKATMDETRVEIDRFARVEEMLLQERRQHQERSRQIAWRVLGAAGGLGLMGTALAVLLFLQLERELTTQAAELRASNAQLETVCAQLQRFTANASHELRAPLAAVLSNAQVGLMDLQDWQEGEPQPEAVEHRLGKIVRLTKQMSELVGQLLWLARHDGRDELDDLPLLELGEALREWAVAGEMQATALGLDFRLTLPQREIWVRGDRALLQQAVSNLLTNACRYTRSPGTISLAAVVTKGRAIVQVSDTGVGIAAEALPHVVEPFYRVDSQRTRAEGFGLGLALTQQIARVHGGELGIESEVGRGTTVAIGLPRV